MDRRHLRRHARDLRLEGDAVPLRLQHLGVGLADADDLQRDLGLALGVPGQEDVADGAAAQKVADLEPADLLLMEEHRHRPLPVFCVVREAGGCTWMARSRETPPKSFQL